MRVAIFGGTFDPIHKAHIEVAHKATERFGLDRVLFVPASHPPHKHGATHAPYADRLRMTELACQGVRRFQASDLEAGAARSYSIETIQKVRTGMDAKDELFFIIGADAFAEIQTWHRWRDVASAVRFLVVSRPGHPYDAPPEVSIDRLDDLSLDISSSEIRAQLARGQRPAAVPDAVLEYIATHGLYR